MQRLGALVALLGALAMAALAPPARSSHLGPDLWATVNICDSPAHPDEMGVRASMPGNGTRQRMYMRFRAHFYDSQDERWLRVRGTSGISDWIRAGSARYESRETGYTFVFEPPRGGEKFVLRGLVEFQWRKLKRIRGDLKEVVVRRARLATSGGHPSEDSDPPGHSSGICELT